MKRQICELQLRVLPSQNLSTSDCTTSTRLHRVGPAFSATATATGDFQVYEGARQPGIGWEYVEIARHAANASAGIRLLEK